MVVVTVVVIVVVVVVVVVVPTRMCFGCVALRCFGALYPSLLLLVILVPLPSPAPSSPVPRVCVCVLLTMCSLCCSVLLSLTFFLYLRFPVLLVC